MGPRTENQARLCQSLPHGAGRIRRPTVGERASAQTVLLAVAFFLLGIAATAFWFYTSSRGGPSSANANRGDAPTMRLSDNTKAVLGRLDSPLEIRFHASLDPATVPESLVAFADRVDQLLAAYAQEAGNKITLSRFKSPAKANPDAAFADGVRLFNLDRGNPCWLGLALTLKGHKESLPRLLPEWEPALEADLTRAIARLLDADRPLPAAAPAALSQMNTAAVQEVKALIPDLAAVSAEEGTRILREAALKEFKAAAKEMEEQVKEAERRLTQAQQSGSATDQQAAMEHLQKVQKEHSEKLKQIATRSRTQIETLQQLKAAR